MDAVPAKRKMVNFMVSRKKEIKSILSRYFSRWRSSRHIEAHLRFPTMDFHEALTRTTYKRIFGVWPDLVNPTTISEKMCWLKINDKRPINGVVCDKWRVRSYAENLGYAEILPKLHIVHENVDDIDFSNLPSTYALKVSNGSSWNFIKGPKTVLDPKVMKSLLNRWVRTNWSDHKGEWYYQLSKPRILIEEYMDAGGGDLPDYKLFVFNGRVKIIQYCEARQSGLKSVFLNRDWEVFPFTYKNLSPFGKPPKRPETLKFMIDAAQKFGQDFPLLRVDFYIYEGKPVLGELSLNPVGGYMNFKPEKWNTTIGDWLKLPSADEFKNS